jgi:hypothetical protein
MVIAAHIALIPGSGRRNNKKHCDKKARTVVDGIILFI